MIVRSLRGRIAAASDLARWRPILEGGTITGVALLALDVNDVQAEVIGAELIVLRRTRKGKAFGARAKRDSRLSLDAQVDRILADGDEGDSFPVAVAWLDAVAGAHADPAHVQTYARCVAGYVTRPSCVASGSDVRPETVPCDDRVFAAALSAATESLGGARAFLATLDPDALRVVREDVHGPMSRGVAGLWEAVDATFGTGAPLGRAIAAHPHLARALTQSLIDDPDRFGDDPDLDALALRAAVDASVPDRMLRHLPVMAEGWRSLSRERMRREDVHCHVYDDPVVQALRDMATLPGNWMPRDGSGAAAAWECRPAVRWARGKTGEGTGDLARLLDAGAGWEVTTGRFRAAGGPDLETAFDDVDDVTWAFRDQLVTTAVTLARERGDGATVQSYLHNEAASRILWSGRSARRCLEMSARWHAAGHAIGRAVAAHAVPGSTTWAPALPDHREGDLEAIVLPDAGSLADEGRAGPDRDGMEGLSHCVGGYARACRRGESRIVGVRLVLPDGRRVRLSTAEFVLGDRGLVVRQHLGERNARPCAEAVAFLDRYARLIASGALATDLGALVPDLMPDDEVLEDAGYDFRRPGAWEAVRDAWAPFLPRAMRDASPETVSAVVTAVTAERGYRMWVPERFGTPGWPVPDDADETPAPTP